MCDWNEEDPHCHLNPVTSSAKSTQKNQSIMLLTLDIKHRSSYEVKNTSLVAQVDYVLTSLFMCDARLRSLWPSLFHIC